MAKCKCRICGKSHDTKDAYKVIVNDKNQYYCSQKEYEEDLAQKKKIAEDKDKVYNLICDIFGVNALLNTALWKEKTVWNKAFSDENIAKYLMENKSYLTSAIARLDSSEYAKIRYLSAILKNSLGDFKPRVEVVEKSIISASSFEFFEPTIDKSSQNEEQVLYDVEDDLI